MPKRADIVEVMATSDNVLRAGPTPKHRDVNNLLASLTWTFGVRHSVTPTPVALVGHEVQSGVRPARAGGFDGPGWAAPWREGGSCRV
jgi:hypothetical protein